MRIILLSLAILAIAPIHAQKKGGDIDANYRRSSLYKLMVDNPSRPYADIIKASFVNGPLQDKFNDHNLVLRTIATDNVEDPTQNIGTFIQTNHIARDIVAKWFNRSAKGGFNMELIQQRGNYAASAFDITKSKMTKRGPAALADAGEDLIKNTFILINDFKYVSKEEVAKKASGWLKVAGEIGESAGVKGANDIASTSSDALDVVGKGYVVKTTAYLFRLDWNEEVAAIFYNDFWADDKTITPERIKAFDESNIFNLVYVGSDVSFADLWSTKYTTKTEEQLIERATNKAVDAVIVELQKNHDEFKTKTPLFSGDPLTAKIGMKEGLTAKSKFDVMELQVDADGNSKYVDVGTIKVDDSHPIWDNRYGATDENPDNTATVDDRTYFKKVSGRDFYPGMLIVQKKGK
jgi:hypothetical protein